MLVNKKCFVLDDSYDDPLFLWELFSAYCNEYNHNLNDKSIQNDFTTILYDCLCDKLIEINGIDKELISKKTEFNAVLKKELIYFESNLFKIKIFTSQKGIKYLEKNCM